MRIRIGSRVRLKSHPELPPGVVVGYDYKINRQRVYHIEIPFLGRCWFTSKSLEVVV